VTDTSSRSRHEGLPAVPFGLDQVELDGDGVDDDGVVRNIRAVPPVAPVTNTPAVSAPRARVPVRLHPDTKERAKYWASKADISVNEYIVEAVEEKIRRENGDYDLPTLEIARLTQLIDQMGSLSTNVANLESVTLQGFDSLMGLTRGDNYLLDPEDGELGEGR
jgi:predicted DNA-binding protein